MDRLVTSVSLGGVIVNILAQKGKGCGFHSGFWRNIGLYLTNVCTNFSYKELDKQVAVDRLVTSGILGGVMVSTLFKNTSVVGSIPTLSAIFHQPV